MSLPELKKSEQCECDRLSYIFKISILALLYYVLGKISFYIIVQSSIVSVVTFFPEGVALAAILIYGKEMWPGIFIGQFVLAVSSGLPVGASFAISAINSIEAIIGYILFYRNGFRISLESSRDIAGLLVIIIFVLQPFSAFFGNLTLIMFGVSDISQMFTNMFAWWFGNLMGQIQLTPFLLYLYTYKKDINIKESLFIVIFIAVLTYILQIYIHKMTLSLILAITMPIVIYISIHKNLYYATLSTLTISVVSLYCTKIKGSLFWTGDTVNAFYRIVDLNFYILAHVLLVLLIGTMFREKERAIKQLEQLAHFDVLTGLPNRHILKSKINKAILHANKYKTFSAVCFLDMDGFKAVNDNYGHDAGDEVLKEIAQRITNLISEDDALVRLGGDEFVLIVTDIEYKNQLDTLLEEMMKSASNAIKYKGNDLFVTLSIGVALAPYDSNNADTLVSYADISMYEAKKLGKNRFVYYRDVK